MIKGFPFDQIPIFKNHRSEINWNFNEHKIQHILVNKIHCTKKIATGTFTHNA